jgi:AraC-like DNA-binding protein
VFTADNANYKSLFNKIDSYGSANILCHGKIKSIMYDLLFQLSQYSLKTHLRKYSMIERGIEYLENDREQALSVAEIAALCNVSEVYFRKLFKEYSGVSPAEYRTAAKIFKAKNYLKQEDLSIADIADLLGFGEVSYFIKVFRKRVGVTPAKYRANYDLKQNSAV